MFKGRTVALLVVAAMLVSSLLTLTLTGEWSFAGTGPLRSGSYADTAGTGSKQDIKKIETALRLVQKTTSMTWIRTS